MSGQSQEILVLRDAPKLVLSPSAQSIVQVVKESGAKGDTGPAGAGVETNVPAGAIVTGHKVVGFTNTSLLKEASNDDPQFISSVLGVSLNAALPGDLVDIATNREIEYSGWSWTMGLPIFLGTNGALTQTPPEAPTAVFLVQVGFPTAPDKMWVEVEASIEL